MGPSRGRSSHLIAHDERVLMKAWAGRKTRDIRRAAEEARATAA